MKKIKVGIIGQGRSGRDIHRHLFECCPKLQELYEVVAVADPIPERVKAANPGAVPGCRTYADYRELLQDKNVELIINASRSHKHIDISIEAMHAGFDVVCEKPLTNSLSEFDRVIQEKERTGKFFAVFQQSRFRPLYRKIYDVILSGMLGEIAMIKIAYNGFGRRWDWQTIQDFNGGELMNTAPHPLDQMMDMWEIFGDHDPDRIWAKLGCIDNYGDADNFVKIVMEGAGHPVFDLEVAKQSLFPSAQYQVFGSLGSLIAGAGTVEWKYYRPGDVVDRKLEIDTLEDENRLPIFCMEKLPLYSEKWMAAEGVENMDDWGVKYYSDIYNAITSGTPLTVKLSQIRRQIAVISECRRQNPLPVKVKVPEGII
ncbi:MAG: Gfo/Idh/MocA family oxidoreductase [Lentisphaerae bacterium]|nr:Gfo/Idh/MocA family oxidoreductase [Lentisphaerota bacterium]